MKNSIVELANYEYENVTGGVVWGFQSWNTVYFITSMLIAYNFKDLNTYTAIASYNKGNNLESMRNIAVGFSKDLYNYSSCAWGMVVFVDELIPYVIVEIFRNKEKRS